MKYLVLIILLFSPVHMQDDQTPEEKAREVIMLYKLALERAKNELLTAKGRLNFALETKQNLTTELELQRQKTEDLKRNISQLRTDLQTCEKDIEQYTNEIKAKNTTNYQQEIDTVENRIQEVVREKNDKMPLTQKQNEEKNAVQSQINDVKSQIDKLKNEKEMLPREIDKCQKILENCNSTVAESSILSAPTCFLNNLIDFKSSLVNNLLSGLLGLGDKKN